MTNEAAIDAKGCARAFGATVALARMVHPAQPADGQPVIRLVSDPASPKTAEGVSPSHDEG
jgi:hypothetical protein